MTLVNRVFSEILTDMDDDSERIIATYEDADDNGKALLDDVFISLCGYSLKTLIEEEKGNG